MKSAKRKFRIYEVPISYHGRTYEEGKKIGWKDGVKALGVVLKFWLVDDLYAAPYGRDVINNLNGTPQYVSWLARVVRPYLGDTVLELGAGIGNLSGRLMSRRLLYVAAEKDPLHLHALGNRFLRTPNVKVRRIDPNDAADFDGRDGSFDTVLCLNVLEYVEDPRATIESIRGCLNQGGTLVVLAPQHPSLYGALDRSMGHKRRFEREGLQKLLAGAGFQVQKIYSLNKIGTPPWWIYSKLLGSVHINKVTLKIFDKTVWFWRRIDRILPWAGLTLVLVARKSGETGSATREAEQLAEIPTI
jgi:SAM-dependent methyltransferase